MPAIALLSKEFFSKYPSKPYIVNNVSINFEYEGEHALNVFISTPHLELEATNPKHNNSYLQMCRKPKVMELYALGKPWDAEFTKDRIKRWENLWNDNIPFSSFAVFAKQDSENFLGHVALDYDECTPKGTAEISYIFDNKFWGRGYSSEAVWSVVNSYSEEISKKNYLCQGKPYTSVYATARPDNPASIVVLWKAGLDIQQQDGKSIKTKWGERYSFFRSFADTPLLNSTAELLPNARRLGN